MDDRDYQGPFKSTGKINKLTIALDPPKLTAEDEKESYRKSLELHTKRSDQHLIAQLGGEMCNPPSTLAEGIICFSPGVRGWHFLAELGGAWHVSYLSTFYLCGLRGGGARVLASAT